MNFTNTVYSFHGNQYPLSILIRVVNDGGIPLGGKMSAFKDKLDDEDILAAIAYFQGFWPEDIYSRWEKLGGDDR